MSKYIEVKVQPRQSLVNLVLDLDEVSSIAFGQDVKIQDDDSIYKQSTIFYKDGSDQEVGFISQESQQGWNEYVKNR